MSINELTAVLGWCVVLNIAVLLVWFVVMVFGKHWLHALMHRWFDLPDATLVSIHYQLMGVYKVLVLVFFLMPYLALRLVGA